MHTHQQITDLLSSASTHAATLREIREASSATVVRLSDDMAAALGSGKHRRLTPFLSTVVDTISAKLEIDERSLVASKVKDTKQIAEWLGDSQWSMVERELYRVVSRDGSAFVLVRWIDNTPDYTVREVFNGSNGAGSVRTNGRVEYTFNAWKDGEYQYLDIYYQDRIEKYRKLAEKQWEPRQDATDEDSPISWMSEDGTPLGIALVEFSIGKSDVEDALQIGQDLNEAVLDMVATSRLQGWPQRYLKGQRNPHVLLSEAGQPLINSITGKPIQRNVSPIPGSMLMLGADADIGQLEGATPNSAALDKMLELLSLVTTVPTHYFSGQWPSGVALIQAESRLNHKVEGHQGHLTPPIVALLRLTMRLSNLYAGTAYNADQSLTVNWYSPQIETEDLKRERLNDVVERIAKLRKAGLISDYMAVKTLYPEWQDIDIQNELARLDPAIIAESPVPTED